MARDMSLGDPIQERKEGGLTSVIEEDLLSKCALFVCNKWEQVPQQEVQSVKHHIVKKLGKVWPGIFNHLSCNCSKPWCYHQRIFLSNGCNEFTDPDEH